MARGKRDSQPSWKERLPAWCQPPLTPGNHDLSMASATLHGSSRPMGAVIETTSVTENPKSSNPRQLGTLSNSCAEPILQKFGTNEIEFFGIHGGLLKEGDTSRAWN
jgi:hypothetical protein